MPEKLAHYTILDRIGAGGTAEIYRARDTRVGRTVTLKMVADRIAGDPGRRERFLRAGRACAALSHPNIATLFEVGEDEGRLFLACEFVQGEPLPYVMGGRPMNPRRALDLGTQMADALADAHALGVVHGDLKPVSVIVTPRGNAKILDFGLSADHDVEGEVHTSADIRALGMIVFEMLTGTVPPADTPARAPSAINTSLPPQIDRSVLKALASSPDERYQSAALLAADLRAVAALLEERRSASERSSR